MNHSKKQLENISEVMGGMTDQDPLEDEDILKIDRLQLINASARYQLLSANQQLLDFHLSRIMQQKLKNKQGSTIHRSKKQSGILKENTKDFENSSLIGPNQRLNTITEEVIRESKNDNTPQAAPAQSAIAARGPKPTNLKLQNMKLTDEDEV